MKLLTSKNLLNQAKIVWKTLVVLLLSALLLAPPPVLALDYNGTLDSYVSNAKVELDGVLTSIKRLPNLSYENGKTTLAEIESKLEKIQSNAGENAANFQKLSNEAQKEYEKTLDEIKNESGAQEGKLFLLYPEQSLPSWTNLSNYPVRINFAFSSNTSLHSFIAYTIATQILSSIATLPSTITLPAEQQVRCESEIRGDTSIFPCSSTFPITLQTGLTYVFKDWLDRNKISLPDQTEISASYSFLNNNKNCSFLKKEPEKKEKNDFVIKCPQDKLDKIQHISKVIALTNEISTLSNNLEKRINLAQQKFGNVKEYADALKSFSDPDILTEINELDRFMADLTNNLPLGS